MVTNTGSLDGRLSDDDAQLFYRLWLGLLDYVNRKHKIDKTIGRLSSPKGLDIRRLIPIREKLLRDASAIDEYIALNACLNDEEKVILSGWKKAVENDFIIMKHFKKHSVLMTIERTPLLYGVVGIYSTWGEMVPKEILPTTVRTVLLPFNGRVIYDGIIQNDKIRYGGGYKKSFNAAYHCAKNGYGIIESFDGIDDILESRALDNKRRNRILDEILSCTYDEDDRADAWYCYLKERSSFPLEAVCTKRIIRSPLQTDERVTVIGIPGKKECHGDMVVVIQWRDREFAVPLEQLKPVNATEKSAEAIGDWQYWLAMGCFTE